MKTTVEKLTATRVKLNIAVTPDELEPSIAHAYEHIGSQVNIPGFRKGKIPKQLLDQRVGREEILNHAVTESLDKFFRQAVTDEKIRVLGRPEADVTAWPEVKDFSGDLEIVIEVDVRPEFDLPSLEGLTLTVDEAKVSADDVKDELDALRSRFGTLVTVDRPAKKGDFAQLDLVAKIGDNEVDSATSISYEVGSGELIEGIDEALDSLSADETTTFESTLLGGDHEGEAALITVSLLAVKERELPEADDDFAQIASQFDTIKELKADIKEQVAKSKVFGQGAQARDQIVDELLKSVEIPVPPKLVEDEVNRHLENEKRLEDAEHRAEVTESSEKTFRTQILLDSIVEAEGVKVSQNELTNYLVQGAQQYGMEPSEFIQVLQQNGQIPGMIAEVARAKALAVVLGKAKVVDSKGKEIDVSPFTASALGDENDESDEITAADLAGSSDDHGHDQKDPHGRKAGHEHFGHDHK
ncbi:trigger factor [Salinibacterium xinjiangense]|uniref:Trigger factor n=1 Tax=Salinibacterium xinjiangense TaxID=386302 RepID=A0A2C8ZWK4_9MICO|nr:trigger factor [Salinibacterium xinjiangense]SOE70403.1 trigger factor [Salinibacterium xinjiangense]